MRWQVVFYRNERHEKPVASFLRELPQDARSKCVAYLKLLESQGTGLPANITAHVEGDIWELRPEWAGIEYRLFYMMSGDRTIYVLHAVCKKQQKTARKDIELSQARAAEIRSRLKSRPG